MAVSPLLTITTVHIHSARTGKRNPDERFRFKRLSFSSPVRVPVRALWLFPAGEFKWQRNTYTVPLCFWKWWMAWWRQYLLLAHTKTDLFFFHPDILIRHTCKATWGTTCHSLPIFGLAWVPFACPILSQLIENLQIQIRVHPHLDFIFSGVRYKHFLAYSWSRCIWNSQSYSWVLHIYRCVYMYNPCPPRYFWWPYISQTELRHRVHSNFIECGC